MRHVLVNGTPIRRDGSQLDVLDDAARHAARDRLSTGEEVGDDHDDGRATSTTTPTTSRSTPIPYPVFRRLREEAPLYHNDKYDFYALSRFDDVERGLVDRETYISGRGAILELIKADIEMPPGVIIFEDPPIHTMHRGLLSRVFTPKKMNALEPKIREFCARSLDPAGRRRTASTSSATSVPRCRCG